MLRWIVGAGGLLGGAIARATDRRFVGATVPWTDPDATDEVLDADLARFADAAGRDDWAIVWAAGAGVVGSTPSDLEAETRLLGRFVTRIARDRPAGDGTFFLASSAGGLYAGSHPAPFDESAVPRPLSPYGEAKAAQEELATRALGGEVPVVIGRLSNLYGPGQDLTKSQGLVSRLCLAAVTRQAIQLFVPMETLRDYLYADDAAAMVDVLVRRAHEEQPATPVVRNLASGRVTSVAAVVRLVQQIARRPIRLGLGASPTAQFQVRDLRIATQFSDALRDVPITPLPAGIKAVYEGILLDRREVARAGAA